MNKVTSASKSHSLKEAKEKVPGLRELPLNRQHRVAAKRASAMLHVFFWLSGLEKTGRATSPQANHSKHATVELS